MTAHNPCRWLVWVMSVVTETSPLRHQGSSEMLEIVAEVLSTKDDCSVVYGVGGTKSKLAVFTCPWKGHLQRDKLPQHLPEVIAEGTASISLITILNITIGYSPLNVRGRFRTS